MPNQSKPNEAGSPIVVTAALPYANGDIHLGHIVEAVQTDVFVRFQKMLGRTVRFMWSDDTHGTPIELAARRRGITPEALIGEAWQNHVRDYKSFSIDYDIFYTTNSPENQKYAELIFSKLQEKGLVVEREIEQYYCDHDKRFLPDRFIKGTCPKCGAVDQYGDVCEVCGTTYAPEDLKDARCMICNAAPQLKKTRHFFVQLGKREQFLREYLNSTGVLQDDMRNFVEHWIDEGLKEWCISRDGPYFGFKIPGTTDKYFYVWLDAPIGYLSSTAKWCADHGEDVNTYWGKNAPGRVVHFLGKDIVYFHTLFWPVMLDAADFKLPSSIFVHGFLTVQGEKMSKSRGTFILADDFAQKVSHPTACEYLRFYYGAKLANNTADIDLNTEEFCSRVNTTLANNFGNLHNRTFVFLDRYFGGKVPDAAWDAGMAETVAKLGEEIAGHFERVEYKSAVEKIHSLGNLGNKYFQDSKPWELIKSDPAKAAEVMVSCANLIKALAVFLKPFIPNIVARIEEQLGMKFKWSCHRFSLRNVPVNKLEKVVLPIERSHFDGLLGAAAPAVPAENTKAPAVPLIDIEDFGKVQLRIGKVKSAERVENSDKLLKLKVDSGDGERQIIAGIGKFYAPEQMVGRQVVFVANLKPATLMGQTSEGMVLAATKGKKLVLLTPDGEIPAGAKVS
jgi:methionyl-tRNA synthetase